MKIVQLCFTALLFILLTSGCSDDDSPQARPIEVRVSNASSVTMSAVVLTTNMGTYDFGDISAFQQTDFQMIGNGFSSGSIKATANSDNFTIQLTGDALDVGQFTYELSLVCPGSDNCNLDVVLIDE